MQTTHLPVMAAEVIEFMVTRTDGAYVDCTVGAGGHASGILHNAPAGRLLGVDLDESAVREARRNLSQFGERAVLAEGDFAEISAIAEANGFAAVDGILFDLGFSSMQLDAPERGFSFASEGPIDMRFDTSANLSARELLEGARERDLARVLLEFGEERRAHPIARAIIEARDRGKLETTTDLAAAVLRTKPMKRNKTLARVFQALRIAVNRELDNLAKGLAQAVSLLRPDGRIVVISYHSLEDRIVKRHFVQCERPCVCPRDLPECVCGREPTLRILTKRVVRPSAAEVDRNSRAGPAKLRAAEKLRPGEAP
jgi:16S rRNA (cytosine1402-N4)-methyltransferase